MKNLTDEKKRREKEKKKGTKKPLASLSNLILCCEGGHQSIETLYSKIRVEPPPTDF